MNKIYFLCLTFLFAFTTARAQLGVMKLVGPDTKDYKFGIGAFIKTGFPVNEGSTATLEAGFNLFYLNEFGGEDGTIMCPLKLGYRYTINGTGEGLYIEPQVGYNLFGVTYLPDENDDVITLKYHGIVAALGTGYLFTLWDQPFDLNFRYETVIAHGGSNNMLSLGISRFLSFGKRKE